MKIRLDRPKKNLRVCEHIIINGSEPEDSADSESEYAEHLTVHCDLCKKDYEFTILVN